MLVCSRGVITGRQRCLHVLVSMDDYGRGRFKVRMLLAYAANSARDCWTILGAAGRLEWYQQPCPKAHKNPG